MVEARWGRRLGPAAMAVVGILGIASTTLGAPDRATRPPPACPPIPATGTVSHVGVPWSRLEPTMVDGVRRHGEAARRAHGITPTIRIGLSAGDGGRIAQIDAATGELFGWAAGDGKDRMVGVVPW